MQKERMKKKKNEGHERENGERKTNKQINKIIKWTDKKFAL